MIIRWSACFEALERFQQSAGRAALAAEVLAVLPVEHGSYAGIADREGQALLALGYTSRAVERYENLHESLRQRAASEPDRADYQRDLMASHQRMGDLYKSLGQGERAQAAYQAMLSIAERLAASEPDRADYQRDLVVSLVRVAPFAENGREVWNRALSILRALAGEGKLNPTDRDMLSKLEAMIQQAIESEG